MGIIDVIVEKPAFRREERAEEPADESTSGTTKTTGTSKMTGTSKTTGTTETKMDSGRGGTLRRTAGALAVGIVGALTLRKLRNRRADRAHDAEPGPEREPGPEGEGEPVE